MWRMLDRGQVSRRNEIGRCVARIEGHMAILAAGGRVGYSRIRIQQQFARIERIIAMGVDLDEPMRAKIFDLAAERDRRERRIRITNDLCATIVETLAAADESVLLDPGFPRQVAAMVAERLQMMGLAS